MENISNRKRPILATIIAILLLISTPFIILNYTRFLINPTYKAKIFDLVPRIISKAVEQKAPLIDNKEFKDFINSLAVSLKEEYLGRMGDANSALRKIETYKAISHLVVAVATIFICIGLLRLKKQAYKLFIVRIAVSVLLILPLNYLSAKNMNNILVSAISKSIHRLPRFSGDERTKGIITAIVEYKAKKQSKIPIAINLVWNVLLLGYFLLPKVRKSFLK